MEANILDKNGPAIDLGQYQDAMREHDGVRADSGGADIHASRLVAQQRAQMRSYIDHQLRLRARLDGRAVSPGVASNMRTAMGLGLGLDRRDTMVVSRHLRADASSHLPGELIDRSGLIVRQPPVQRVFQEVLPMRSVDPGMAQYEARGVGYEGSADIHRPGATSAPQADYYTKSRLQPLVTLWTTTNIEWPKLAWGNGGSAIDPVAEAAESATRVLLDLYERLLLRPVPNLDLSCLGNLGLPQATAAGDYRAGSTITLGAAYAAIVQAVSSIIARPLAVGQDANYASQTPNTAYISKWLWLRLMALNNLDDGGSQSGGQTIQEAFLALGITRIMPVPALDRSPTNDNNASMVLTFEPDDAGLKRVVAAMPAPVRVASDIQGDRTVWAMRIGGLECPNAVSHGIVDFRVRGA